MDGMTGGTAQDEPPPPGRYPGRRYFSAADLRIIRTSVDGLRAFLIAERDKTRAGTRGYHSFGEILGNCARISAQLARAIDEEEQAGQSEPPAHSNEAGSSPAGD
jgi:hypothetical protein